MKIAYLCGYAIFCVPRGGTAAWSCAKVARFFARDSDVGDVETVFCENGTGKDETEVSVGRDVPF